MFFCRVCNVLCYDDAAPAHASTSCSTEYIGRCVTYDAIRAMHKYDELYTIYLDKLTADGLLEVMDAVKAMREG